MTTGEYKNTIKQLIQTDECNIDVIVDSVLSYVFSFAPLKKTITWEVYHWSGTQKLFVKTRPLVSVQLLEYSVGNTWYPIEEYTPVLDMWFIYLINSIFPKWYSNIRVNYTWWYETIPGDLQGAIISMIEHEIMNRKSAGLKSESIDDYSVSFDKTMPNHIANVFSKYKEYNV